MGKTQVGLVDLGERLPIRMRKVERQLNKRLRSFHFQTLSPVTVGKIGQPRIENEWYDVEQLFECVRSHQSFSDVDLLVGITHAKMTERPPSQLPDRRDYFSLSDYAKVSVISLNDAVRQHAPPVGAFTSTLRI